MMEAVSTSETSVNFYQTTWYNIPEDGHLASRKYCFIKSDMLQLINQHNTVVKLQLGREHILEMEVNTQKSKLFLQK
jgi:hypothetical protein